MKGFDSKFIDELKNKNDIVQVASKYVHLEQKGANYWGRCPFHHEKTASFAVNARGQFFNCFGCHKSGDVITLIQELENLDFVDAVKFLAERAKMPLPEMKVDDEKIREQKRKRDRTLALLKDTAYFYVNNLKSDLASKHIEYILKRGFDSPTVTKFGIGASLDFGSLPNYLRSKGYTEEEMLLSGAVSKKDARLYDALGGRLIIPIINQFGQVIAFGGRLLEKADFAKYKNTNETIVFSKSNTLYNLNNVKKLKNEKGLDGIIIVEGYMDTISLVKAGFENVVASMGTSLTKDQARILKRYTDKVYISYDGDFAGQKASLRGLEILKDEGLEVKVVCMPEGAKDPDELINKFGVQAYRECLEKSMLLIDFKLFVLQKEFDLTQVEGKRKFVVQAIKIIRESPSPSEQEDLLKNIRDLTGITFETLKRELLQTPEPKKEVEQPPQFIEKDNNKTVTAERFILAAFLFSRKYIEGTDLAELDFTLPIHKQIKNFILEKEELGESFRFNDLYELIADDERDGLSKIAGLETDGEKDFDSIYFGDCIRTVKLEKINRTLDKLTTMFSQETDTAVRGEMAKQMTALIAEKNKLMK